MTSFFLDMGGAGLFQALLLLGLLFIVLATLIEAVVMILLKYNTPFKKAFGDSVFANLTSLFIGFLLIYLDVNIFDFSVFMNFLVLYGLTVVIEGPILYFLNREKPFSKTLIACVVMNLASYALLYLLALAI